MLIFILVHLRKNYYKLEEEYIAVDVYAII